MEVSARIELEVLDEDVAMIIFKAIQPETIKPPTERSQPKININKNIITIQIYSKDLTSIRASINSYLRWIKTVIESLEVVNEFEYQ